MKTLKNKLRNGLVVFVMLATFSSCISFECSTTKQPIKYNKIRTIENKPVYAEFKTTSIDNIN